VGGVFTREGVEEEAWSDRVLIDRRDILDEDGDIDEILEAIGSVPVEAEDERGFRGEGIESDGFEDDKLALFVAYKHISKTAGMSP
jgi:hypothetical protein